MRAKLCFTALAIFLALALPVSAQTCVSLTNITYTQNFDTLANTGTSSVLPTGWFFSESGTNANATYTAGTGSGNAGDTYSFGAAASTDRALGGLQSGSLIPAIGACFVNNSGSSIEVSIGYTGEQWRLGQSGRGADRLDFQYSTDATALNNGTWTDFNALDFSSPIAIGTVGALDGNAAANRTGFSSTALPGVTIPNGGRLFIRWLDFNVTGSDDGLAVDDFSLTPGVTSNLSGLGAATPPTIARASQSTLLTVAVTPAGSPASTGITVTADLSSIGGSATQTFFDDGSNGDAAASDNTFSFQTTAAFASLPGVKSLPVTIADAQARSANASISLTVTCSFTGLIGPIQGSGSRSPYEGCSVSTTGIVTGKKSNGFFMQSAPDGDPNTSDGVFVFTSSTPAVNQGDSVQVGGTVQEFSPSADPNSPPATEIAFGPTVAVLSSGNPLPAPVTLTAADTNPAGGIDVLEKYEGMRVHVDTLNVVAPTGGSVTESSATSTSSGVFYGVLPGIARPFREPGVTVGDPLPSGSPCCVPRFDNNPERIRVDTKSGQPAAPPPATLEVTTGATVTNLTGPLDYGFRAYTIMQELGSTPVASGNVSFAAVPAPLPTEVTVASFNMERFFDTTDDPSISDVALTTTAFNNRLAKASLVIRNVLHYPDVIGVEEMENLTTLQAVAGKVNTDAVAAGDPNPNYQAFLVEGNDIGGIDVGFLVKTPRISTIDVTQFGLTNMYANPAAARR
jgi:hypothetical protein